MPRKLSQEVRDECLRLRVEERLSIGQIQRRTGVSRSTVSGIVKDHPLSWDEVKEKHGEPWNKGKSGLSEEEESKFSKMASRADLDSMQIAKIAESAVLFRLCLNGFATFGSPFDGDRTDWLVEIPGSIVKVQVKTVEPKKNGAPVVPLTRTHKQRYQPEDFDFIIGYDLFADKAYVFSKEEVEGLKCAVAVRKDAEEAWEKLRR